MFLLIKHRYFRARHYDPKIGRFISRDSFEGVKTTPISLNPYLYAHSDPVNGIDPTGHFGLMDINISSSIQSTLNYMARDYLQDYIWNKIFGGDEEDGKPGLIDSLLIMLFKALSSSIPSSTVKNAPSVTSRSALFSPMKYPEHHTIPIYMCGPISYTYAAPIETEIHDTLHLNLFTFSTSVDIAGKIYDVAFNKKKKKEKYTATTKLARTIAGRKAIAARLLAYYTRDGYIGMTTPIPKKGMNIFGEFFAKEEQRFTKSKRAGGKYSYPLCKRKR